MYCIVNGEQKELHDTGLPLTDLGIIRGYGYFDYLRTYNNKPFLLDEHLDRLERTATLLQLPVPYKKDSIKKWIYELLRKNDFSESHVKIVVTGGPSEDGATVITPSFFILVTPLTPYPSSFFSDGVNVMTYEHLRMFPEAKSLNYLVGFALREEKKAYNAFEIVFTHKGNVLEATTSNIFMFKDNVLITPSKHILQGITRNLVLRLAKDHWNIEERDIREEEFFGADELFMTASNKEVMPIVRINNQAVANGMVGSNTQKLHFYYKQFIADSISLE